MDEIEYIKKMIRYCDIEVTKNGKWLIHRTIRVVSKLAEEKKDFSPWNEYSQWDNYSSLEIEKVKDETTNEPIPDDYIKEEWFQLEVIKYKPRHVHYFEHLATVNVLECGIEEHGESVIAFLNPIAQRDLLQNANYADIRNRPCILDEILKSSGSEVFREYILKIVHKTISASQEYINRAIDTVLRNAAQYECFAECALELAENGNERAQKIIINHPEIEKYKEHILKIVHNTVNTTQENISSAIGVVLKNAAQDYRFAKFALELAENGNDCAQKVVINHPEMWAYKDYIIRILSGKIECSNENINLALNSIMDCPRDLSYSRFVVEVALVKRECSKEMVEKAQEIVRRFIIKNLKIVSQSLPQYDIIGLADIYPEALDFIWRNLDDIHYRNYFVTKILNANQDFEIYEIKSRFWKKLLKENGLPDDVSNQIRCSYQEEYGKLSLTDFKTSAKSVVKEEASNNIYYTYEQWSKALLARGVPAEKLNHSFFKFESWQKNRNMKWLENDSYKRYWNAVEKGLIQIASSKKKVKGL